MSLPLEGNFPALRSQWYWKDDKKLQLVTPLVDVNKIILQDKSSTLVIPQDQTETDY